MARSNPMTPQDYASRVQELAGGRAYAELLTFVERHGPQVEDQLTAEQVRILRVHLKHADMVLSGTRSKAGATRSN